MPALMRACFLALLLGHAADAAEGVALLRELDTAFAEVFAKAAPAVVVIEAVRNDDADEAEVDRPPRAEDGLPGKPWKVPDGPALSEGSGFIIRADGHILTNLHVVAGAREIEVRTYDGRHFEASLLASDERMDIAVLKIEADRLAAVVFADSDAIRVGQLVCAIGAPYNQDYSFTCGWVSGKGRNDLLQKSMLKPIFEDYIQTDAFINPGNSGGPLLDVEGRVVGMNTLINGLGRGLAFAIPSNQLRPAADQLIEHGRVRRPWLGVRITSLQENKAAREQFPGVAHGVLVSTVEAGGPAYRSDLQPGDLLTAVDGVPLRTAHDLIRAVQRKGVGNSVQLAVQRGAQSLALSLTTDEQPDDLRRVHVPRPAPLPEDPADFGLKLTDAEPTGAKVVEIIPDSPAARADLRVGDVVSEVNAEEVANAEGAKKALHSVSEKPPGKGVLINFYRGGKKSWAVIERPNR
jgi:serine protease Do